MTSSIGLDIGGTKIGGAVFDAGGKLLAQNTVSTPAIYSDLVEACGKLIAELDKACGQKSSIGIGTAGMIDRAAGSVVAPNIPCLKDRPFRNDMEKSAGRPVHLANDADCAALAEAIDGAGKGHRSVFGLVIGTGVGGGFIIDKKIYQGPHGLAGEIGHLPLPFRDADDGPVESCACGQKGCIDKTISGPALARLYKHMIGKEIEDPRHVVTSLQKTGDDARRVLDRFYITVAKALVTIIHAFDPEIIVVNGGLHTLPGLYEEVPKRWERYALCKNLRTRFVAGAHGAASGVRGAALAGL